MADNYEKIQKAKDLVPFEVHEEGYWALLFVIYRALEIPLKESIQLIQSGIRQADGQDKVSVDHMFITPGETTISGEFMEILRKVHMLPFEAIGQIKDQFTPPKSNLVNLLWIEAVTTTHIHHTFERALEAAKKQIYNKLGG